MQELPRQHAAAFRMFSEGGNAMAGRRRSARGGSRREYALGSAGLLLVLLAALLFRFLPDLRSGPDAPEAGSVSAAAERSEEAEVYFFDVGQGDSALIRAGTYTMLIDAGLRDSWDALHGDLEALGVTELDCVIATHPHADHIGGMEDVIRSYEIGTFYMPILPDEDLPTTVTFEKMLDALEETGTTVRGISAGTKIPSPDGARFEVLSPEEGDRFGEMNDYSAVVRFTFGNVSFLFTGDAEREIEERLLSEDATLSAQVLKCGHHGSYSATSVPFLYAVSPRFAVISCGKDNSYGHPHRETIEALESFGCEILRTDAGASFAAFTDGTDLTVCRWTAEDGAFALDGEPAA